VIAAAVIASLAGIIGIAALTFFYLLRKRKRPISRVPTEDITLTHTDKDKTPEDFTPIESPAPVYRKYLADHPFHGQFAPPLPLEEDIPRVELPGTQLEVHQLPDHTDGSNYKGDYHAAVSALRAANTPEVDGNYELFELQGCAPAIELDDVESRGTLSPAGSVRTPINIWRRPVGSPRTPELALPSPLSAFTVSAFTTPAHEQRGL